MTKKKKPVRGRPELPEKEKRSVLMQFRVTENESSEIRAIAEKSGLSVSDWIRSVVQKRIS